MAYATPADVKAFTGDSTMSDAVLNLVLPAVSELIDRHTGRTFEPVLKSILHPYMGGGSVKLKEELVTLTNILDVADNEYTVANGTVSLFPYSGPPYSYIDFYVYPVYSYASGAYAPLTITGIWGYKATVPESVKLAAIVAALANYQFAVNKGIVNVSGGGFTVTFEKASGMDGDAIWSLPDLSIGYLRGLKKVTVMRV